MLKLLLVALGIWVVACFGFVGLRLWVAKKNDAVRNEDRHLDLAKRRNEMADLIATVGPVRRQ